MKWLLAIFYFLLLSCHKKPLDTKILNEGSWFCVGCVIIPKEWSDFEQKYGPIVNAKGQVIKNFNYTHVSGNTRIKVKDPKRRLR